MSIMFEKIGQAAEKAAADVSRRQFFGRMARWATAAAIGITGLMTAGEAVAAPSGKRCCSYFTVNEFGFPELCGRKCINANKECPTYDHSGCFLGSQHLVSSCQEC